MLGYAANRTLLGANGAFINNYNKHKNDMKLMKIQFEELKNNHIYSNVSNPVTVNSPNSTLMTGSPMYQQHNELVDFSAY